MFDRLQGNQKIHHLLVQCNKISIDYNINHKTMMPYHSVSLAQATGPHYSSDPTEIFIRELQLLIPLLNQQKHTPLRNAQQIYRLVPSNEFGLVLIAFEVVATNKTLNLTAMSECSPKIERVSREQDSVILGALNEWNLQNNGKMSWDELSNVLSIRQKLPTDFMDQLLGQRLLNMGRSLVEFQENLLFYQDARFKYKESPPKELDKAKNKINTMKRLFQSERQKRQTACKIKFMLPKYADFVQHYSQTQMEYERNLEAEIQSCIEQALQKIRQPQKILTLINVLEYLTPQNMTLSFKTNVLVENIKVQVFLNDLSIETDTNCALMEQQEIIVDSEPMGLECKDKGQSIVKQMKLVTKKCLEDSVDLRNQIFLLRYMRFQKCARIATYYCEECRQLEDLERIFVDFYPSNICRKSTGQQVINMLIEIAEALCFLWEYSVVHRDLKPDNILLSSSQGIKLIDFGSAYFSSEYKNSIPSKISSELKTTRRYNIFYQNLPRQLQQTLQQSEFERHYRFDIYALGKIIEKLTAGKKFQAQVGSFVSECLLYLSDRCVELNPNDRPDIGQVLIFLNMLRCYMVSMHYWVKKQCRQQQ